MRLRSYMCTTSMNVVINSSIYHSCSGEGPSEHNNLLYLTTL